MPRFLLIASMLTLQACTGCLSWDPLLGDHADAAVGTDAAGPETGDAGEVGDGGGSIDAGMDGGAWDAALPCDAGCGQWRLVASMPSPRRWMTATLLADGRVLVAGGDDGSSALGECLLFEPATETFSPTGSLHEPRYQHTATLLPDGTVLAVGGYGGFDQQGAILRASAEVYAPGTGQWTLLPSGLQNPRVGHSATLMADGKVMIAGGTSATDYAPSLELFDPNTGFLLAGTLAQPRYVHAAVASGASVLIIGGRHVSNALTSVEMYDTSGVSPYAPLPAARWGHQATRLQDGRVLITGGFNSGGQALSYRLNPASGTWATAPLLKQARWGHQALCLANGDAYVVGGVRDGEGPTSLPSAERLSAGSAQFEPVASMHRGRLSFALVALPDGRLLALGGTQEGDLLDSVELYTPDP